MSDTPTDDWTAAPAPDGPPPATPQPPQNRMRRRLAGAALITGLGIGGLVGGYAVSHAANSTPTSSPSASANDNDNDAARDAAGGGEHHGGRGEDLQVAADAIGINLTQLRSELSTDKTVAAVAKAHNVDVNKVIAALVTSENKEIDDRVSSGRITQAQATQMKSQTQQRVTDAVNGTFHGGWGHHHHHNDNDGSA